MEFKGNKIVSLAETKTGKMKIVDGLGFSICTSSGYGTTDRANMLLYSKAPDMLKELQNTLDTIDNIRLVTGRKDIGGYLGALEYRINTLIKEATTL